MQKGSKLRRLLSYKVERTYSIKPKLGILFYARGTSTTEKKKKKKQIVPNTAEEK